MFSTPPRVNYTDFAKNESRAQARGEASIAKGCRESGSALMDEAGNSGRSKETNAWTAQNWEAVSVLGFGGSTACVLV